MKFLFGVHSHQPVGNFDHVFEWAYQKAYLPFVKILEKYPDFRMTLHFTGPLLVWIKEKHPDFIKLLASMVERKQVEFVVSGFYEPVLWSIPHRDRVHQIRKSIEFVKQHFGDTPIGLWLTERVWESDVVRSLVEAGIRYVLVDDFHFMCAGKSREELHGYYLTEYEGKTLAIFPIDQKLRYTIPFRPIHETIEYLSSLPQTEETAGIIFDDGEKFGVWPGTYEWVYDKGWLELFMKTVVESQWLNPLTFREFLNSVPPLGRIYLPSASYFEMSEWSLPARKALEFADFIEELKKENRFERYQHFVRGGIWPNFLVKYEESNRMHKKMLCLSGLAWEKDNREALDCVHKAQCNDAYWHGVFGGLYLPHLRHAVYKNLIDAERMVAKAPSSEVLDIDKDGFEEIILRNSSFSITVAPHRGGGVTEISSFRHRYNLGDTLTRRFEHYHRGIKVSDSASKGVASIHEIEKVVDSKTFRHLKYDWHERLNFIEHILPETVGVNDFQECNFIDMGDFTLGQYDFEVNGLSIVLKRDGIIRSERGEAPLSIEKAIKIDGDVITADYSVSSPFAIRFGVEFNLALPSSDNKRTEISTDGAFLGDPSQKIDHPSLSNLTIKDANGMEINLWSERKFEVFAVPIYTVSQSESGFDLTYQQTAILLIFQLVEGQNRFSVNLKVS